MISAGCSLYGKREGLSSRDLLNEAIVELFSNCPKLSRRDIQAFYLGQAFPESFEHQGNSSTANASSAGMVGIPTVRVDTVSSSGGSSLRQGVLGILSGLFDVVICAGAEKMTSVGTEKALEIISMASERNFEQWNGATLTALNALAAREHMRKYGTTEEQLARVSVKNHKNAYENPKAYLHKLISVKDVLSSRPVSSPLKLLDCSPICDGASCVVLCKNEIAKNFTDTPIEIVGSAEASDYDFVSRNELTSFSATKIAARSAFEMAGVSPGDMDFLEVHDAFSINEVIAYEDLGLCNPGQGGKFADSGSTEVGGGTPVNPSGGLKAKGHPVGSSGVGQAYEVFMQLRGKAQSPSRQIKGAAKALTHSMGGAGVNVQVHIFKTSN